MMWITHGSIVRRGVTIGTGAVVWEQIHFGMRKDVPFTSSRWQSARIIRYRFEKDTKTGFWLRVGGCAFE